ncbi:MAG: tetratricopeptide repeat protein, partial [Pseudomonadales bacterium]
MSRPNIKPSYPPQDYFHRAISLLRDGHTELALAECKTAIVEYPEDANLLCLTAQCLMTLQRFDAAEKHADKARALHPKFPGGHEIHGDLLLVEGKYEEAIKSYEETKRLDPRRNKIEDKLKKARQLVKASTFHDGDTSSPNGYAAEINQATEFETNGEPEKAEAIYRDILRQNPNHVEAMRLLAVIAKAHKKYGDAELLLKRAVSLAPDYARAWLELSSTQQKQEKHEEAINSAQQVVNLTSNLPEAYMALANAYSKANQSEQSIENYRKVIEIVPKHPGAHSGLSHQLKTIGNQAEAIEVHRQNIAAHPDNTDAYWNMANMKTFRFEDHEVEAMEDLLDQGNLDDLGTAQLCNALGLEYEGRKNYKRAFKNFQSCNFAQRKLENYDPVENEIITENIIAMFNEAYLEQKQGLGNSDASPIFIVGLPRSGSTLIEQILA